MPAFPEHRREPEARQGFITTEQHQAIRTYLRAHEDGAAYADALDLSMLTGWRKGQTLHLRWENVHKDEIRVAGDVTKNEASHVIPIVPALAEIIERRRAARVVGSAWVFCRKDGSRIGDFEKAWKSATKAAGCEGVLYHDSRRSGVRNLTIAGVPQSVAMKISGHKTDAVFRRYNIVTTSDMRKALEAVSADSIAAKVAPQKRPQKGPKGRVVAMGGRRK
ncbi:MAG TPA: site-specific integrase [Methylomirabilota bacterium]|nr:site-specific integrase [Methylomirabilota bacterium]